MKLSEAKVIWEGPDDGNGPEGDMGPGPDEMGPPPEGDMGPDQMKVDLLQMIWLDQDQTANGTTARR